MISSMTGFGRGEAREESVLVSAEIRSLNHRFLDIDVRLPRNMAGCEMDVRELIGKSLSRGRVSATVSVKGEQLSDSHTTVDLALAAKYVQLLSELKSEFGLGGEIEIAHLLGFSDIFAVDDSDGGKEILRGLVKTAVKAALDDLRSLREREGKEIEKDLRSRVLRLNDVILDIEKHVQGATATIYARLLEKVNALMGASVTDTVRLEMEVAILAEKSDVTEECIRFKSHNTLFLELLVSDGTEGRKLNFLLQEMHREANTIGAKANDAQIAHWVVDIKEEVEKLREQIQNIE